MQNISNLFTLEDMPCFKYYQGVNHSLYMYHPIDVYINRKGCRILKNPNAKPCYIFQPSGPLSVWPCHTESINPLALPGGCFGYFETPESHNFQGTYDVCIVSRMYSTAALGTLYRFDPDYADRLFNIIPVFDKDPRDKTETAKAVGIAGFRKLVAPRKPISYLHQLNSNSPSLAAMALSVECFPDDPCTSQLANYVKWQLGQRKAELMKKVANE